MCFAPHRRAIFRHLNFKKSSGADMFCTFSLGNVLRATAACNFSPSQLQNVVRECSVFVHFHFENVLLATAACNFSTSELQKVSKSGPNLTCFVHVHLKMCFSPQRRAIFQHLNFKKCSENVVFCTFSLENVLLATAACNFSFLL